VVLFVDPDDARRAEATRRLAEAGYPPLAFCDAKIAFHFFCGYADAIRAVVVAPNLGDAAERLLRRVRLVRPGIGAAWIPPHEARHSLLRALDAERLHESVARAVGPEAPAVPELRRARAIRGFASEGPHFHA
jgi:hypothetical protein